MLNIPGPEKVNELFEKVFYEGLEKIQNKLETEKISTEVRLVQENITGYEGYLVVKADGCQVKKLMIALEETKIGRLYDIDVLEKEYTKISRKDLGFPERKCLLCDNPACQCGRSRKHSIEELRKKIYGIIWEEQLQRDQSGSEGGLVYNTKTRLILPGGYRCAYRYELSDISKEYRGDRRRSGGNV